MRALLYRTHMLTALSSVAHKADQIKSPSFAEAFCLEGLCGKYCNQSSCKFRIVRI